MAREAIFLPYKSQRKYACIMYKGLNATLFVRIKTPEVKTSQETEPIW